VPGQWLDGWLATVEKTVAQTGSSASTPARSQISASGWRLRSFSSTCCTCGAVSRSMRPASATTTQPSHLECSMRMPDPSR
jgi:hypothetical protein